MIITCSLNQSVLYCSIPYCPFSVLQCVFCSLQIERCVGLVQIVNSNLWGFWKWRRCQIRIAAIHAEQYGRQWREQPADRHLNKLSADTLVEDFPPRIQWWYRPPYKNDSVDNLYIIFWATVQIQLDLVSLRSELGNKSEFPAVWTKPSSPDRFDGVPSSHCMNWPLILSLLNPLPPF